MLIHPPHYLFSITIDDLSTEIACQNNIHHLEPDVSTQDQPTSPSSPHSTSPSPHSPLPPNIPLRRSPQQSRRQAKFNDFHSTFTKAFKHQVFAIPSP